MSIGVWDYLTEFEQEREDIYSAIEKVFRSGRLILGESLANFENQFSAYCGVGYGIGVDNGTNALFLGLKALGIGPGDTVITVANTAVPTVSAIVSTGATPKFIDVVPGTYLMDVAKLEEAITPDVKCILPVHLYGQCVDMDLLMDIAVRYKLKVLEDCAQCHGAEYKGKKAGSFGDLATFSFYPTKVLGTYGDGGMVITNSEELNRKMRRLRYYGMDNTYYAEEHGYNSRLDELHAGILLRKFENIEVYIEKRRKLASRYNEQLASTGLRLPEVAAGNRHVYYLYVVRHPERGRILKELAEDDITLNVSYPWPIHIMRGYTYLGYKEGDLPVTEAAAKEIFSLPMYPALTFQQQDRVCEALGKLLAASTVETVPLPMVRGM